MIDDKWFITVFTEPVVIPEWMIDQAFCEVNKAFIETPEVNEWAIETILPMIKKLLGDDTITICANHFHIGAAGLTPHDHLPHAFTSVLYLTDAEGELVIHLPDGKFQNVVPKEGRLVFLPAHLLHHVEQSPNDELRISFVSNYEYTTPV
jgi:hypothetical protein